VCVCVLSIIVCVLSQQEGTCACGQCVRDHMTTLRGANTDAQCNNFNTLGSMQTHFPPLEYTEGSHTDFMDDLEMVVRKLIIQQDLDNGTVYGALCCPLGLVSIPTSVLKQRDWQPQSGE